MSFFVLSSAFFVLFGCAAHRFTPPSGPGQPFADYEKAFHDATSVCRGVRSLTAELRLSGRAGSQRLRGRLLAGLAEPASLRLEGLAPFGPPAFILVSRSNRATLLLPRDELVLRNEQPSAVLSALAGLALEPDDLRVILTGCGTTGSSAAAGRLYTGQLAAVEAASATLYIKMMEGRWRTQAVQVRDWTIEYGDWLNGLPRRIRLSTRPGTAASAPIDLTVEVVDLQTNAKLDARAFEVDIPRNAQPLTLDELRRIGPLGERDRQ